MKSRMWLAAFGGLLCVRLVGAQSVEMNTKPLSISPGAEVGGLLRLKWKVRQEAAVVLQVVDAAGKLVRTLDAGHMAVGDYNAVFDGKDFCGKALPAGEYRVRLSAGFKPEADMSFGAGGMIGAVTRKFTFNGDRKFDLGMKGFDAATAKVKVDGEAWDREDSFKMAGDNFRADGAQGTIEINPQADISKGSEVAVSVALGVPLENPWAIKTAPDGSLYVADDVCGVDVLNKAAKPRQGFVYKTDASGRPVQEFGQKGILKMGVADLATDAEGALYVSTSDHHADVFDANGVRKYSIAGYINPYREGDHSKGPEGGYYPRAIALNESKRMVMVNLNQSVVVFDATKPDLTGYLGIMDAKHNAQMPPVYGTWWGPCVAATGDVFFQTTGWSALCKIRFDAATGEFSTIWMTPVHAPGIKLAGPEDIWQGLGIELDRSGLIYVADRENHRIQVFFDAGLNYKHVGSFGSAGTDAGKCQMMAPHAVCLTPDRKCLYVADDGVFLNEGDNLVIRGLSRVTKLKLGFGETIETKLTVK